MERLMKVLNSPFGLLVAGAIISGLLVQYVTSKWQERSWLFQQRFTSEKAKFDKELEEKYKLLEEINAAVAPVLTHAQSLVVGYEKGEGRQQQDEDTRKHNEAVIKWYVDFRVYVVRFQTFYSNREIPALWDAIKKQCDALDYYVYRAGSVNLDSVEGREAASRYRADSLKLIEQISNMTADLSQLMFAEINQMKWSGWEATSL